jgi:hypothetical protein
MRKPSPYVAETHNLILLSKLILFPYLLLFLCPCLHLFPFNLLSPPALSFLLNPPQLLRTQSLLKTGTEMSDMWKLEAIPKNGKVFYSSTHSLLEMNKWKTSPKERNSLQVLNIDCIIKVVPQWFLMEEKKVIMETYVKVDKKKDRTHLVNSTELT